MQRGSEDESVTIRGWPIWHPFQVKVAEVKKAEDEKSDKKRKKRNKKKEAAKKRREAAKKKNKGRIV